MSSYYQPDETNPYATFGTVSHAGVDVRAQFLTRTYMHLAGAVSAFIALEAGLQSWSGIGQFAQFMTQGWNAFVVMLLFMGASFACERWALTSRSLATQYACLAVYVGVWAIVFVPILHYAKLFMPEVIAPAAVLTLVVFAGLTATVFYTRKDFSFLGPILSIAGWSLLGVLLVSAIFGFNLGIVGAGICLALACGYILYDTSNVMNRYAPEQYVGASVALFGSVAYLFYQVLRILMYLANNRD